MQIQFPQLISVALICCLSFSMQAQSTVKLSPAQVRTERAVKMIKALKEGAIIFRLPTKNLKIDKLMELVEKYPDNKYYQKTLETTKQNRDSFNMRFVQALHENYDFSHFYVLYDTTFKKHYKGDASGLIFLDATGKPDPSISLDHDPVVFSRIGRTDIHNTSGSTGVILLDDQLKPLDPPFPYFIQIEDVFSAIDAVVYPKKYSVVSYKKLSKRIRKWNKDLNKFYAKTLY